MTEPKFKTFTLVHVQKEMPYFMAHFESDFDAIVGGSYLSTPRRDGSRAFEYLLYKLENGKIVNCAAWYCESQLSALDIQDKKRCEKLVEEYKINS